MNLPDREGVPEGPNPLAMAGLEFVEYVTSRPQALAQVLHQLGFVAVAQHRSREVTLYRQGGMNLVVNAHPSDARLSASREGQPVLSAVAFRVQDALAAHRRAIDLGAWELASQARAMELHIPAIHGPGGSRLYFVDRWQSFSIYDVDFVPIPQASNPEPLMPDWHYFGVVQYTGSGRSEAWSAYFRQLLGFEELGPEQRFGVLPRGRVLLSPCRQFCWQLVEPELGVHTQRHAEYLQRIAIGTSDVLAAVALLQQRGIAFVDSAQVAPNERGAVTRTLLGSLSVELVHSRRP